MSQTNYDMIIVGGGIVGMSAGYHAVLSGAKTLLIDRADKGYATTAGAGIIAPEASAVESDEWFAAALGAVEYYPILVEQLKGTADLETGYAATNELVVAISEDEDAAFHASHQRLLQRQARYGRPLPHDLELISPEHAQQLFPDLASPRKVLRHGRAARVDGRLLTAALRNAALQHGLNIREAAVDSLVVEGNKVTGVRSNGDVFSAAAVIIAGGAWSGGLLQQVGLNVPLTPQRGQIIHLRLPGVDTSTWPIVVAFHGHYILPWPDSRVVVGATRESVGFQPTTTAIGIQEVLSEAFRVAPGLAQAEIGEIRVGLRPGTPDHLPILGAVPQYQQVYVATGHGANGLLLGPLSGKLIVQLALGSQPEYSLAPYNPLRFKL